jgi:hypothetical protein
MKHIEIDFSKEMEVEKYAQRRIVFNIKRYRAKATMCRETYLYLSLSGIVLSSSIPILINFDIPKPWTTGLSFLVVVLIALENVFHFRDRWKNYQIAEELLRREEYLFGTNSDPYAKLDTKGAFNLLVRNIEAIIKDERDKTIQARSTEIKISKENRP